MPKARQECIIVSMSFAILILLLFISVCLTAMSSAYAMLSTAHLRYWARQKDPAAKKLYPLKARGSAVLLALELLRALAVSGAFIILASMLNPWQAWLAASGIFFLAFIVLTQMYLKPFGLRMLATLSNPLLSLTQLLKPVTLPLGRVLDRFIASEPITLTKSDLSRMVEEVSVDDTDLSAEELRIIRHALSFGDKTVHDVMTPWSSVTHVKADEILTPVILDELHKSGHRRFPVRSADEKETVGLLYMNDVNELTNRPPAVKEVMHSPAVFVNEDRELDHALSAFLKTKQHMFVVVNGAAEAVGLVTIDDVVEQIVGKPIADAFDKYEDKQAVAEAKTKASHKQDDDTVVE
jgi:CBS domain containing-hemolysin-like protein